MLQALPGTALWHRLEKENRLQTEGKAVSGKQTTLMNFVPTRPLEEIAWEYINCFWQLYEPSHYLARVYRHYLMMKPLPHQKKHPDMLELVEIRALLIIFWRQGMKRSTRWQFAIIQKNPGVFTHYLTSCAHIEHFLEYRQIIWDEVTAEMEHYSSTQLEDPSLAVHSSV